MRRMLTVHAAQIANSLIGSLSGFPIAGGLILIGSRLVDVGLSLV
jgi:hypothetical protein